jgi:membrane protein implicated in regulation of membrane protease activity
MTLETVYWIALGAGVGFLLLSIVFGDVFDVLDFLDFDLGDSFSATPVLFTALAGFGAGGLLGLDAFDLSAGTSVFAGLGTSVVLGALAAMFFKMLAGQQGESFATGDLLGAKGRCVLAVPAGRDGKVAVQYAGMTRTYTASSTQAIGVGEDVVVTDVVGNNLRVRAVGDQEQQEAR